MSERKAQLQSRLTRARSGLLSLLDDLAPAQWQTPVYSEGEMSRVIDIVNHLADAESGMLRNLQNIVAGGEGVPADFDRDRYNDSRLRKTRERTPAELRRLLDANRAGVLAFLEGLTDADLERQGRHAMLEIMSVEQQLKIISLHEKDHTRDIRQALRSNV